MATTVRVDDELAATLKELAVSERRPIGQVIEAAVRHYQREKFWRDVEASVGRLRADPVAWQEYQDEIRLLEGGSMDGLEAEEPYYTAAEVEEILDKQD
ncbi:MAG TPA: ribbon-helix-helix protein, CopG family [Thermomicrobiales bacterium]|nr:ribbon-helix-helix protein, CopG family [Thermomicrobiales bacterium]